MGIYGNKTDITAILQFDHHKIGRKYATRCSSGIT